MSIIKHHIPSAKTFSEVDYYSEKFDDGVRLARVVNNKVNNPYRKTGAIYDTNYTNKIKAIYNALQT